VSPPFLICDAEGDYFDLRLVPERYTGYSGKDAHRVWRSIYEENCFGLSELNLMAGKSPAPVSLPDTMIEVLHEDGQESDPHCLEKRVYYKVISGGFCLYILCQSLPILLGLHASISTHVCHEYLNQTTGQWVGPFIVSLFVLGLPDLESNRTLIALSAGSRRTQNAFNTSTLIPSYCSVRSRV